MNPITTYFNSAVGSTSSGAPLQPVLSAPSPPGWSARWSPEYHRLYYVEAATGQRLWHIQYSAKNNTTPPPIINSPAASPQLPPGWVSQHSHEYNRSFYVSTATGESQRTLRPPPRHRPPSHPLTILLVAFRAELHNLVQILHTRVGAFITGP
ncbi:hypothetical protein BC830DRAFT_1157280 [Chytriomyces sp. MP71]|nr:hypothetical protein BC830DRAFT_1157280 [Chytriomyces sp. MP71]